jgi:hypothetical protein
MVGWTLNIWGIKGHRNRGDREKMFANTKYRVIQAPTWGYPTEGAYYRDAQSVDAVLAIRIPFLAISAEDDPVSPFPFPSLHQSIRSREKANASRYPASTQSPTKKSNKIPTPCFVRLTGADI